jgi:CubicO group peptidase (beta-lactamase class C family)
MQKIVFLFLLILPGTYIDAQIEKQRIDSLVTGYVSQSEFTGSVLVSRGREIIISKGYGYSNAGSKIPNSPSTIFNIASLTKTFTAALIMKLQEAGKLSVQDRLQKYLPDYPNGDKITIRHLLTHTSGIPDYLQDKTFQSIDQTKEIKLEQMIGFFRDKPLDFEPGTKFRYSNSGYTLLGFIIEQITGKKYGIALQEMIFQPLKMQHTSYGPPVSNTQLAEGYQMYFKNFTRPAKPVHPSVSYATGAIYSTVEDLYKWHLALQGKFFNRPALDSMYKKDAGPYGFGWFTDSLYGRQRVSHDGNIPGYKANINRMPGEDICVIALSNSNNSSVGGMVRNIVNILCAQPLSRPFAEQPVINLPDSLLKEFTGIYQYAASDSAIVTVRIREKDLSVTIYGQPAFDILPVSRNQFKKNNTRVEFMKNQQGKIETILIYQNGEFLGAKKIAD